MIESDNFGKVPNHSNNSFLQSDQENARTLNKKKYLSDRVRARDRKNNFSFNQNGW